MIQNDLNENIHFPCTLWIYKLIKKLILLTFHLSNYLKILKMNNQSLKRRIKKEIFNL